MRKSNLREVTFFLIGKAKVEVRDNKPNPGWSQGPPASHY